MNPVFNRSIKKLSQLLLGFLLVAVIVAACVSKADDLSKKAPGNTPAIARTPVDGIVVQPSVLNEELEVIGSLVANQQVDIVSELTRKIVSINVKEGTWVNSGTLLFKLDDADLQAQLERLRQEEKLALLNEERLKDLIASLLKRK